MKKYSSKNKSERPQFLSGWKEIGNYLGKGVRTVQRYERQMGLPVRRPAGKPRGSVVALIAELDGWITASPIRDAFRLRSTAAEHSSGAQAVTKGLSQLASLRDQMVMLRAELQASVAQLQHSVLEVTKGLELHLWKHPLALVSSEESDLLEGSTSPVRSVLKKFPKAS
jgi:hypothetical protein